MLFHFQRKPGTCAHGTYGRARKCFSSVAKQRIFREIQCIAPAQLNFFHSTGVGSLFCPEGASFSVQGRGKSLATYSFIAVTKNKTRAWGCTFCTRIAYSLLITQVKYLPFDTLLRTSSAEWQSQGKIMPRLNFYQKNYFDLLDCLLLCT